MHPNPLVICLHSSGGTGRQWRPLADRLGSAMGVVAPDLHGHGEGPAWHAQGGDILAADAEDIVSLARGHRGPVHLVGHSWGGAVALAAARRDPARFESVAVYEPVLFRLLRDLGVRNALGARIASLGRTLAADLRAQRARRAAGRFVDFWNEPGAFAALPPLRQDAIAARMPAIAAHFDALWHDGASLASYRTLDMPVKLFLGSRTRTETRRIAELLAGALPQVDVQSMTAMGHMGPLTHPHTVAQTFAAFVGSHALAPRTRVARAA
jgi:pimeloyl-ACP methyl ester carboxylesterase